MDKSATRHLDQPLQIMKKRFSTKKYRAHMPRSNFKESHHLPCSERMAMGIRGRKRLCAHLPLRILCSLSCGSSDFRIATHWTMHMLLMCTHSLALCSPCRTCVPCSSYSQCTVQQPSRNAKQLNQALGMCQTFCRLLLRRPSFRTCSLQTYQSCVRI